ncbi:MAG: SBBP repeat-containing protein [Flavobacteriales bacterium]|nr:SBBP repeat-containing protein [Flavobacteriales bacterium]
MNTSFKSLLALSLLLLSLFGKAQDVTFEKVAVFGADSSDVCKAVVNDKTGNIYSVGFFEGKVDFDPGKGTHFLNSNGLKDGYLLKLDKNNNLVWVRQIGGVGNDLSIDLVLDPSGNVYVTGAISDSVDFSTGTGNVWVNTKGKMDVFISKYDSLGNLIWAGSEGSIEDDLANGIAYNNNGSILITGYISDTVTIKQGSFNTRFNIFGGKDIFIGQISLNGAYEWFAQLGGKEDDESFDIVADRSGNVYTTGSFRGSADFAPGSATSLLSSFGDADIFVSKLDGKGNFSWVRQLGGRNFDEGRAIDLDGSTNVYTTGYFYGVADFDPSKPTVNLSSNGNADVFFSKLNSAGNYVWAKSIGGTEDDFGLGLHVDGSNNLFYAGSFRDKVDFDPGAATFNLSSDGSDDAFAMKLASSGNFLWSKKLGGKFTDAGLDILVDGFNKVQIAGYYSDTADFDPYVTKYNEVSNGKTDAFINTLEVCTPSYAVVNASNCYSYSFMGNAYSTSGSYQVVVPNHRGCDSVITLNLTIYSTTIGNLDILACKSYTLNGITYTTAGTYQQLLTNTNGCDSVLVLELKFGESSGKVNAIACDLYTLNGKLYTQSGDYTQTIKNKVGCDSVISLKLTIKKSNSSVVNVNACDSFHILNETLINSGTYNLITKNTNDCDSSITLNLTLHKSTFYTLNQNSCSNFILNNDTFTKTGIYTQKLTNHRGCDSTIKLDLKINNTHADIKYTACRSYLLNGINYSESGQYTQIIKNAKGCDSTINLDLIVNKVDAGASANGAILKADISDLKYQWLDCNKGFSPVPGEVYQTFLAKESGSYAVSVTDNSCTDTSICLLVDYNYISTLNALSFKLLPNPVKSQLQISGPGNFETLEIQIFDILGKVCFKKIYRDFEETNIDFSSFNKGVYHLSLIYKGGMRSYRILKE